MQEDNLLNVDQFGENGDRVRIVNKMKTQSLMSLSISFADKDTLRRIQEVFHSLPPNEIDNFRTFLDKRQYLSRTQHNTKCASILNKLCQIALMTEPKDLALRKIRREFTDNLKEIDEMKIAAAKTKDFKEVGDLVETINNLNDRNIELFEEVNRYSQKQKCTV